MPPEASVRFDLKTLFETSRVLSGSLDLDFVANNLLLSAMSKLFTTRGCVWLVDEETGQQTVRAAKGGGDPGECRADEADFEIEGVLTDDAVPSSFASQRIRLVAPISFGKRRLGLLGLGGKATGEPFDSAEIEFVSSLVNMSSAAIHNSLAVEKLRTANRELDSKIQQLNTLFDLSKDFNSTIDRETIVRLLTLTLMGQMLVSRHIVLVAGSGAAPGEVPPGQVQAVTSRGITLSGEEQTRLCELFRAPGSFAIEDDTEPTEFCDAAKLQWLRDHKIVLVLPVRHQGATCGILCLGRKQTRQAYTSADIDFLSALANLFIVSMQNSFLVAERIEKERLEEEMRLAREIQEKLQPAAMPEVADLDVSLVALPSRHVAGDYVDVQKIDGGRLMLAIGDVTGKGMPASLLMSNIQACLHMVLPMEMTLEEATGHINRVISANTGFDKFITYFHGVYHPEDSRLDYVNAGHNPPILLRADGTVELLEVGGLLLGVMSPVTYERGTVELKPGDVLVMFTDGVTEAMNPSEEEYEEHRLIDSLKRHRELDAKGIIDAVVSDIEEFVGGSPTQFDDLTMIVIKR